MWFCLLVSDSVAQTDECLLLNSTCDAPSMLVHSKGFFSFSAAKKKKKSSSTTLSVTLGCIFGVLGAIAIVFAGFVFWKRRNAEALSVVGENEENEETPLLVNWADDRAA